MTEHNENSAFVPVPETGIVVPTSDRIRELEAALAKAEGERAEQWRLRREAEASRDLQAAIASDEEGRSRRLEAKLREALEIITCVELWADKPLVNDLEVGFRHSPLTVKEREDRYQETCSLIAETLRTVAQSIEQELK